MLPDTHLNSDIKAVNDKRITLYYLRITLYYFVLPMGKKKPH